MGSRKSKKRTTIKCRVIDRTPKLVKLEEDSDTNMATDSVDRFYRLRVANYTQAILKNIGSIDDIPSLYQKDVREHVEDHLGMSIEEWECQKGDSDNDDTKDEKRNTFLRKIVIMIAAVLISTISIVGIVTTIGVISDGNAQNEIEQVGVFQITPTDMVEMLSSEVTDNTLELITSAVNFGDVDYKLEAFSDNKFKFIHASYYLANESTIYATYYYSEYNNKWMLTRWYLELPPKG